MALRRRRTGGLERCGLALAIAALGLLAATALPAQELTGLRGERLTPGALASGDVIVVSWASWSPRCRDIVARVNRLVERWGGEARVITVNFQEDAEAVRAFLGGEQLRAPVFLDRNGDFSKKHAVTHLPGLLVLREGRVAFNGRLPQAPDATLESTLGGGPGARGLSRF